MTRFYSTVLMVCSFFAIGQTSDNCGDSRGEQLISIRARLASTSTTPESMPDYQTIIKDFWDDATPEDEEWVFTHFCLMLNTTEKRLVEDRLFNDTCNDEKKAVFEYILGSLTPEEKVFMAKDLCEWEKDNVDDKLWGFEQIKNNLTPDDKVWIADRIWNISTDAEKDLALTYIVKHLSADEKIWIPTFIWNHTTTSDEAWAYENIIEPALFKNGTLAKVAFDGILEVESDTERAFITDFLNQYRGTRLNGVALNQVSKQARRTPEEKREAFERLWANATTEHKLWAVDEIYNLTTADEKIWFMAHTWAVADADVKSWALEKLHECMASSEDKKFMAQKEWASLTTAEKEWAFDQAYPLLSQEEKNYASIVIFGGLSSAEKRWLFEHFAARITKPQWVHLARKAWELSCDEERKWAFTHLYGVVSDMEKQWIFERVVNDTTPQDKAWMAQEIETYIASRE